MNSKKWAAIFGLMIFPLACGDSVTSPRPGSDSGRDGTTNLDGSGQLDVTVVADLTQNDADQDGGPADGAAIDSGGEKDAQTADGAGLDGEAGKDAQILDGAMLDRGPTADAHVSDGPDANMSDGPADGPTTGKDIGSSDLPAPQDAAPSDLPVIVTDSGRICTSQEICNNGLDDNCDDLIDEGCPCSLGETQSCFIGNQSQIGVGRCKAGIQTCVATIGAPVWGECIGATFPEPEQCNGIDDDCDGKVDELTDMVRPPCRTLGVCKGLTAKQTCAGAAGWRDCSLATYQTYAASKGLTYSKDELCDGQDNNCNGSVDEGLSRACGVCDLGHQSCINGNWGNCVEPAVPTSLNLTGTVRDFMSSHVDFETTVGTDRGIVTQDLSVEDKPIYNWGTAGTLTTHGDVAFNQWYRNVPGVNLSTPYTITLTPISFNNPITYSYNNSQFFPIDEMLFGNEGELHNYHFTFELHTVFLYRGGETFKFSGDDDLWVYINKKRVIDLGGIHPAQTADIDLDSIASTLGLTRCKTYRLDLFFAERHTPTSTFRIDTSLFLRTNDDIK